MYLVLGLYLDAVLPQQYGVRQHPLFFLKALAAWGKREEVEMEEVAGRGEGENEALLGDQEEEVLGDVGVQKERELVASFVFLFFFSKLIQVERGDIGKSCPVLVPCIFFGAREGETKIA